MGLRFCNIPLFFLLFLAFPAMAAQTTPPLDFKGHYALTFAGIPFGKMDIAAKEDASSYSMSANVASTGVVNMVAKHSSLTTVTAKGKNFNFTERSYKTSTQTRNKKRDISMKYKNGAYMNEVVTPPDNRKTREEVPGKLKNDAYDPLSIVLELRHIMMKKIAQNDTKPFSIKLYDGRRLTRADATVYGRKTIAVRGVDVAVVHIALKREPIAGFTEKELTQYQRGEPPLDVYFSDDENFLPVKLNLPFTFGSLEATLAK